METIESGDDDGGTDSFQDMNPQGSNPWSRRGSVRSRASRTLPRGRSSLMSSRQSRQSVRLAPMTSKVFRERMEELAQEYERLEGQAQAGGHNAVASMASDATVNSHLPSVLLKPSSARSPHTASSSAWVSAFSSMNSMQSADTTTPMVEYNPGKGLSRIRPGEGSATMSTGFYSATGCVRECFRELALNSASRGGHRRRVIGTWRTESSLKVSFEDQLLLSQFAMDPSSAARSILDACLFLCCIYDLIVVPYALAWKTASTPGTRLVDSISLFFWLSGMLANFFTGYYSKGILVTNLRRIAKKYLCSFFLVDALVNGLCLYALVLESNGSETASVRLVRVLKLNRLARVLVVLQRLNARLKFVNMDSSSATMVTLGAKLTVTLLALNHVLCCVWYWLANSGLSDTGADWLDMKSVDGVPYESMEPEYQYLTALHWAMTQMTPGSMSVVPQNSYERLWNLVCLVIGLFASSLLISQLSAKMVRVQTLDHDRLTAMHLLSRFLSEQSIPRGLAQRIRQQVYARASIQKPLTIQDLPSLSLLPPTLQQELSVAIFSKTILRHTVFYAWCTLEDSLVMELCSKTVELEVHAPHDEVFLPGQQAEKVYNVQSGSLVYLREVFTPSELLQGPLLNDSEGRSGGDELEEDGGLGQGVAAGEWFSFIALWCRWQYIGTMRARDSCQLVSMHVKSILKALKGHPSLFKMNRGYAHAFAQLVSANNNLQYMDLDINPAKVMMALPLDDRLRFTTSLTASFAQQSSATSLNANFPVKRNRMSLQFMEGLNSECETGACVISLGGDGQLLRTALRCSLEISRSDRKVLVRVGELRGGELVADCALPATKVRTEETAEAAARRLLDTDVPKLRGELIFESNFDAESAVTSTFGVRTCFIDTHFHIFLDDGSGLGSFGSNASNIRLGISESEASSVQDLETDATMAEKFTVVEDFRAGDTRGLYVWMEPTDFEHLRDEGDLAELEAWLEHWKKKHLDGQHAREIVASTAESAHV